MPSKTIVIANPRAGGLRDGRVDAARLARGGELHIPPTLEALDHLARRFLPEDRVVVAGGDGTFRRVLEAALRAHPEGSLPTFAHAPGGTNDALARSLGIRRSPTVADLESGAWSTIDFRFLQITARSSTGAVRVFHASTLGAGMMVDAFREYTAKGDPGLVDGLRAVALPLWEGLTGRWSPAEVALEAELDGEPLLPGGLHVLLASVVDDPIRFLRPFGPPLAGRPAFHVLANGMKPTQIAGRLVPLFYGLDPSPEHVLSEADRLRIRLDGGLMLDGDIEDLEGSSEVDVALGVRLRLSVPPESSKRHLPEIRSVERSPAKASAKGVEQHVEWFEERYGDALSLVILIGSCVDESLRSETSIPDFFVILDDYRGLDETRTSRVGHHVLPPDLYHLVSPDPSCKYYVVDRRTVWRETGPEANDFYILGRLSKRTALVHARDERSRELHDAISRRAAMTASLHAVTLLDHPVSETELTRATLRLSYRAERRLEDERKIEALYLSAPEHYARVFGACLDALEERGIARRLCDGRVEPGPAADRGASEALMKRALARTFLRWPKMMVTVDDWLALLTAKLERTHDLKIEIPAWERRVILITGWRHYFRLKREGKIR